MRSIISKNTTVTGIGNVTTVKDENGHVNVVQVRPLFTTMELFDHDESSEKNSCISIVNDHRSRKINIQSLNSAKPFEAKTATAYMNSGKADVLSNGEEAKRMLTNGKKSPLANNQENRSERKQKKKLKKKRKKKEKLDKFERAVVKRAATTGTSQKNVVVGTPRYKQSDNGNKRIIVNPGEYLDESHRENTTGNKIKTTNSYGHVSTSMLFNENIVTAASFKLQLRDFRRKATTSLSPIIEDIEDTIDDEFNDKEDYDVNTPETQNDTRLAPVLSGEVTHPLPVSGHSIHKESQSYVSNELAANNTDVSTYKRIGRLQRILKMFKCCFTSNVED